MLYSKILFVMFFKGDLKNVCYQKSENITTSVFFKRFLWCFRLLENLIFFYNFWKTSQRMIFSTYIIFAYVPPSAINRDRLRAFDQKYFLAKLAIYARQLSICKRKNHHHHGFLTKIVTLKKSTFSWKFHYTHFFRTKCSVAPNLIFFVLFFDSIMWKLKAPAFQNTLTL